MAVVPPPSKPKKRGQGSQFSLDMDAKGLITFLVLITLSLATAFYLGMIYGKAQRVPEPPGLAGQPLAAPVEVAPQEDLSIYNLKKDQTGLENLKKDFEKITDEADQLQTEEDKRTQSRTDMETRHAAGGLELEPEPAQTEEPTPKKAKAKENFEPSWTDKVLDDNPKSVGPTFSVQVMATRSRDRAEALVTQLKNKGFDAYLEEVKLESATVYRIRVGKESKEQIGQVKNKLEKSLKGLGTDLKIIQLQ